MTKKHRSRSLENIYVNDTQKAIYVEISLVKRKIKLAEGERNANYELNEEELRKNEILIEELRQKNTKSKKEYENLRQSKDNYFKIVANVLGDEKKAKIFQGKTFEETQEFLESLIGDRKNTLNLLKYNRKGLKRQLEHLRKEEQQLERVLFGGNRNISPMLKEVREAENNVALMQMRITEAENLQAKYKVMLDTLKQENYTKATQLRDMEQTITFQKKEEMNSQKALDGAIRARKEARKRLSEVEDQTLKAGEEREDKLLEARLHLRGIREEMEEIGTKLNYPKYQITHRDSSLANGYYLFGTPSALEEAKEETLLEGVYTRLAEMTGVSDPAAIVTRFQEQRTHAVELKTSEDDMKSQVRKAKLRKRFLEDKLAQLQFSGGIKREKLDKQILQIEDEIVKTTDKKFEAEKRTGELTNILEEMIKKLTNLCLSNEILEIPNIKLQTSERVQIILKALLEKVDDALHEEEAAFIFRSPMLSPDEENPIPLVSYGSSNGINNLLENESTSIGLRSVSSATPRLLDRSKLSPFPANIREHSPESSNIKSRLGNKRSDSSEEEATSRSSIKRQSQIIVDAKTRKGRFKPSTPIQRHNLRPPPL